MIAQITRNVEYSYVPPRCRKPRIGHEDRTYELKLNEVDSEAFPVACTVHKQEIGDDKITTTEYRTIYGRLFRPAQYSYCKEGGGSVYEPIPMSKPEDVEQAIKKLRLFWNASTEEQILEEIDKIRQNYIIYDGFLWMSAGEPYYKTSFDPKCLYVSIRLPYSEKPMDMPQDSYRADETDLIRKAISSADYASQDVKDYALKGMDEETITLTDAFTSIYADRETRLNKMLEEDVRQKLTRMVQYVPNTPALLEKMTEKIATRVKGDPSYKKRGNVLFDDIFYDALFAELSSVYGIPYTPIEPV